ncbi:diguanylate cyclase [Arcobacter sp. LA11]|uniref:diguanylate cyclase n=1 Tax=Arcobacter sp. LA11 TaxID=1898176 RepID=UPI000932255F|nr:diguanylate cyclase [Arcobacter sp. LA11]
MLFSGIPKLLNTFVLSIIFLSIFLILKSFHFYKELNDSFEKDIKAEARVLNDYIISMKDIYQKQLFKSGLELNEKTLGFIPAHASSLIPENFKNQQKYYIKSVSDRPRNKNNKADKEEQKAIEFFNKNDDIEYFEKYNENGKQYYQFATRINIEQYCLKCHGKKENVLPIIKEKYDDLAYNYKLGDLRGIISIKIPTENINNKVDSFFKRELIYILVVIMLIGTLLYLIYKKTKLLVTHTQKIATDYAMTDSLTGLYNRHYLKNIDISEFVSSDYYIIFFDIDYFKKVNDLYGHTCGDLILKEFSIILNSYSRNDDILCRYGGEEFILIIKDIDKNILEKKLEKIRKSIEENKFIFQEKKINITTSIGYAKAEKGSEFIIVLEQADSALYTAKERGRNQIIEYERI